MSNPRQPLRASTAQESPGITPLRIAIFGFGTVGSSVARILAESQPEGLESAGSGTNGTSVANK